MGGHCGRRGGRGRLAGLWLSAGAVFGGWGNSGFAAPPPLAAPSEEAFQPDLNAPQESFVDKLYRSSLLLGDMGGLRTELSKYGMSLALQ